jgi:hypothetical protein
MWRIVTGFVVGYYLGTKAGREKLVELRSNLRTIATSETVHQAIKDGSAKIDELTKGRGMEIARSVLSQSALGGQLVEAVGSFAQRALATGGRRAS